MTESVASMPVEFDHNPKFSDYSNPEVLVSTQWLDERIGQAGLVIVESDEDVLLYETGHIRTAVKIDWHTDLNDPVTRDYLNGEDFAKLLGTKGISRDTTVVIYGDNKNWWATYAFWVFKLFGHPDVRILDGGRETWVAENRELVTVKPDPIEVDYPVIARDDKTIRAYRDDVLAHLGGPLVDVRSPQEYSGERTHMPNYPDEGALRGGHIPGAKSIPWSKAAGENGVFKTRAELEQIYLAEARLNPEANTIAYCRIGERSSHTWFVLTYLLGFKQVRNYDGSWTEWGSLVGVPIIKGEQPGVFVR